MPPSMPQQDREDYAVLLLEDFGSSAAILRPFNNLVRGRTRSLCGDHPIVIQRALVSPLLSTGMGSRPAILYSRLRLPMLPSVPRRTGDPRASDTLPLGRKFDKSAGARDTGGSRYRCPDRPRGALSWRCATAPQRDRPGTRADRFPRAGRQKGWRKPWTQHH